MPNPLTSPPGDYLAFASFSLRDVGAADQLRNCSVLVSYDESSPWNQGRIVPTGPARLFFAIDSSLPLLPGYEVANPLPNPIRMTSPPPRPGTPGIDVHGRVSFYTDAGFDLVWTVTFGGTTLGPFPIRPTLVGPAPDFG